MIRRLKRRLMISVAVLAVLAGVTAAVVMAAQPSARTRHHKGNAAGPLAAAASYLGLSAAQLRGDLQSGRSLGEIANSTAGKSQAGLIEALETADRQKLAIASARLPQRVAAEVERVGGPLAASAHRARRHGSRPHALSVASQYLGVSTQQLHQDLRSGTTLAQVAKTTSGKSEAGLIEALVAARKAQLAKAIQDGRLTQAQVDEITPKLVARVTAAVNRARG